VQIYDLQAGDRTATPLRLQQSLQDILATSTTEREFVCRASLLVPSPRPESKQHPFLLGESPTLVDWTKKRYLAFAFANPAIQSPISTFGHNFLVATNHQDGKLELDAIALEFTADGAIDTLLAIKALTISIDGQFHLRWFLDKQLEYDLKDRDIWLYPVKEASRTPAQLDAYLKTHLEAKADYRFTTQNCADRIFEILSDRLITNRGTRLLAIPLEELREIVDSGWTLPPVRVPSSSSRCEEAEPIREGLENPAAIRKIRILLQKAAHSMNPREVEALRDEALNIAKLELFRSRVDAPIVPRAQEKVAPHVRSRSLDPVYLHRGPDIRFEAMTNAAIPNGFTLGMRIGSFDFVNTDLGAFDASALEFLSAEATTWEGHAALKRLTLLRLDTLEVPTDTSAGQVRWIDVGWHRPEGVKTKSGRPPGEAGLSYGSGTSWGWGETHKFRVSLLPMGGIGASWNTEDKGSRTELAANLGLRGQLQVNTGAVPRGKVSVEWRALELNSPYRIRYEAVLVPWEFKGRALSVKYTTTDHRQEEWAAGIAIRLR